MEYKLFMILLGSMPPGRMTEQHDVFFGIAPALNELVSEINNFWPNTRSLHIDVWQQISYLDGHAIKVLLRSQETETDDQSLKLFFINLGGYKRNEFDEYHFRMIVLANNKTEAINKSKATYFYKTYRYKEATSHIDDKYGIDVDDIYELQDILPKHIKDLYKIVITPDANGQEDVCVPGYLTMAKLAAAKY